MERVTIDCRTGERDVAHLTAEERADLAAVEEAVVRRIDAWASSDRNVEALRDQATQALRTNRDYLAEQSPSAIDVHAQVERLTRQNQALIRLVVGLLDGVD